jgi:hypothetical protein
VSSAEEVEGGRVRSVEGHEGDAALVDRLLEALPVEVEMRGEVDA